MKKLFSPWWLLVIAALGTAVLAWAYWGGWNIHPHTNAGELGQLGDFFGGMLNPLVSTLTLFVAISVWRLQKDEMKQTRQQVEQQRFFDLLNVYNRTVENISFTHHNIDSKLTTQEKFLGKFAISAWLDASPNIRQLLDNRGDFVKQESAKEDSRASKHIEQMNHIIFEEWAHKDAQEYFGSYFRVVRHLLSEAHNLLGDQHFRYVALFCAQLSRSETILLALHLWLDPEGQEVHPLAGKYGLLKNLPEGDLHTTLEDDLPPEVFKNISATSSPDCLRKESSNPC